LVHSVAKSWNATQDNLIDFQNGKGDFIMCGVCATILDLQAASAGHNKTNVKYFFKKLNFTENEKIRAVHYNPDYERYILFKSESRR
jgi:hypothetical protein